MRTKLTNYIRSGHAGLYIVSAEEARVEAEIKAVAEGLGYGPSTTTSRNESKLISLWRSWRID